MKRNIKCIIRIVILSVSLILAMLILVMYVRDPLFMKPSSQEKPGIYYSTVVATQIKNTPEYQNASIDVKMDLFLNHLYEIAEDGTEEYPYPLIDADSIISDKNNYTVTFCDCDGLWWRYEFDSEIIVGCNVGEDLWHLTQSQRFTESDTDTQMEIYYQKLMSMSLGIATNMNEPLVDPDSIMVDDANKVIYYQCVDDATMYHYSFVAQSFTDIVTPTPPGL